MEEAIYTLVIFVVILFLYMHIVNHYKKSEDLEVYEMDFSSNNQLQEICDVKQPVLFEMKNIDHTLFDENLDPDTIGNQDVKLKDSNDYFNEIQDSIDYIVIPFQSSRQLMKTDPKSHFFIENNEEFIEESGLYKAYQTYNQYLKPSFSIQTKYDLCTGSKDSYTPLRYHTHYRQFYIVSRGKIQIKMTPWKSSKYLHPKKDYENYEFYSQVDAWKPQKKYLNDLDKIRFLEFEVNAGYAIYIPPYWWYTIKYWNDDNTILCGFHYDSIMNAVAQSKDWVLYFLQQQNIQKKMAKTLDATVISEPDGASHQTPSKADVPDTTLSTPLQLITAREDGV